MIKKYGWKDTKHKQNKAMGIKRSKKLADLEAKKQRRDAKRHMNRVSKLNKK